MVSGRAVRSIASVVLVAVLPASVARASEHYRRTYLGEELLVEGTGLTFGPVTPGVYAVDGTLDVGELLGRDATSAWWRVDLYAVSFDINRNGTFYEAEDAIFETMPWPHVSRVFPDYQPAAELLDLDLERERESHPALTDAEIEKLLDPVPRLYASSDGTWELYGGQTQSHLDPPTASRRGLIASGTFVGDFTAPRSFTQTEGMGLGFVLAQPLTLDFVALLPGDIDRNRHVNVIDVLALAIAFGQECDDCFEDVNKDGVVGIHDIVVLSENFGSRLTRISAVAVPEPSALTLLFPVLLPWMTACRKPRGRYKSSPTRRSSERTFVRSHRWMSVSEAAASRRPASLKQQA